MATEYLPPVEFLRECFLYNPKTGLFTWKHRPEHHFDNPGIAKAWNSRWSGLPAFTGRDKDGYARNELNYQGRRVRIRASRVAFKMMTGLEPDMVDHRNRKKLDNRFRNLRAATHVENCRNVGRKPGKKLPKGVFAAGLKYEASYSLHQKKVRLGYFATPEEAHAAYCAAASVVFGEFFSPN